MAEVSSPPVKVSSPPSSSFPPAGWHGDPTGVAPPGAAGSGRILARQESAEPPRKRLRSVIERCGTSLHDILVAVFPDRRALVAEWLEALGQPSVCISSLDDLQRLDAQDVSELPVPPLVKSLFREVIAAEAEAQRQQQQVLGETIARAKAFLGAQLDRSMRAPREGARYFQDAKNYRLILTSEEIEAGVRIVAHRIEKWCKGHRIVIVGILKGVFMFISDLCRELRRPYSVFFVDASSYGDTQKQVESVAISSDLSSSKFVDQLSGVPHKIVLIDELLDNGKTMHEVKQHFLSKFATTHSDKDILTCCLFSKNRERKYPEADITGIRDLPDLWVVGYGLDDRGTKRGWTDLFAIPKFQCAETMDGEEVERLIQKLDSNATLTAPLVFAGKELKFGGKDLRFRVSGLDASGDHERGRPRLRNPKTKIATLADLQRILTGLSMVKGKYDHELQFTFVAENVPLVDEDEIFHGNNQIYAQLRCQLRTQIQESALKHGVRGLELE